MKKAIFFDRDDTLIVNKPYLHKPEDIVYFSDTFSALKKIQDLGYLLFIVTNQSGVGRKMFTIDDVHKVHQKLLSDFLAHNVEISDIKICPHAPTDGCDCRKPSPKMILELIDQYSVDRDKSLMVGDKVIDYEAGVAAGLQSFIVNNPKSDLPKLKSLTELATRLS